MCHMVFYSLSKQSDIILSSGDAVLNERDQHKKIKELERDNSNPDLVVSTVAAVQVD